MRSLFLSYFVYIRYKAIFYFGKLTESNNLSLLKCILYYTINVVVNLLRREKGMESIIIKPERVFQEGYRYYISYITHPVKWKSALRKWYFIKYVRDLDLFSFERQHYPYNLVFVCCNPPEQVAAIQADFERRYFQYMKTGDIDGLIALRTERHDYPC